MVQSTSNSQFGTIPDDCSENLQPLTVFNPAIMDKRSVIMSSYEN
jgi:hypothetical protein